MDHFRNVVRSGRCDYDEVCPAGKLDVVHLVGAFVPHFDMGFLSGERFDRERGYELRAAFGEDAFDGCTCFGEQADEIERFIGGDAAGNNQENAFSFKHDGFVEEAMFSE